MKIRYMSDLHLEFEDYKQGKIVFPNTYFSVPPHEDDADTILVLAGDVAMIEKPHTYLTFMEKVGKQFREVLYVPGNHEFYRGNFNTSVSRLKQELLEINVRVLDNSSVKIDDYYFYGTTLWTDFKKSDPLVMYNAAQIMSDYRVITEKDKNDIYHKLKTITVLQEHMRSVKLMEQFLVNHDKTIVITHHLPSFKSVNEKYHGDDYANYCYYSDLDWLMVQYKPILWFHGHTHDSCNYDNHGTNVLCNPRGYVGQELNANFDVNLYVEI